MKRLAALLLLLIACAHDKPCIERDFCPTAVPAAALDDPAALHALILDARTRHFPPECFSCEEETACAGCERFADLALARLTSLRTEGAAAEAAAVVADERMQWDGGAALMAGYHVSRMGPMVLPHLRPYASRSTLAAFIVDCMEHGKPCY